MHPFMPSPLPHVFWGLALHAFLFSARQGTENGAVRLLRESPCEQQTAGNSGASDEPSRGKVSQAAFPGPRTGCSSNLPQEIQGTDGHCRRCQQCVP